MKKIALAAVLPLLLVTACGDDDDTEPISETSENPTVFTADDLGGSFADARFIRVTIDGMPCIVYKDSFTAHRAYSGLTCDWTAR